nr:MAG: major capsid protein [Microvirus sp.]
MAQFRNMQTVVDSPRMKRVSRSPSHPWQVRHKPFALCPFAICPVLPGETLKNALFQARVVTKPVKSSLLGWWIEHYFFYVKHRDNPPGTIRDGLTNMALDLNWSPTPLQGSSSTAYYSGTDAFRYQVWGIQRIVEEYFRNDGETWNNVLIGGYPAVSINQRSWMDSTYLAAAYAGGAADPLITVGVDDQIRASEIDSIMQQWQFLRANNLTQMDYEDFLTTYGVRPTRQELHVPELLRYSRQWQYPSNTVEPTTGVPTAAVSWVVSERMDKERFFREPGFIIGVTCARPKVYLSRQLASVTGYMQNVLDWLPGLLAGDETASMRQLADTKPVDVSDAAGIWYDVKDLFMYGEQFVNFSLATTDAGFVALPDAAMNKRYPSEAMVDALFVDAVTNNYVQQDGLLTLNIATSQKDMSGST